MDIKDIIKWSIKHWLWFVISVMVCGVIGGIVYLKSQPKYNVNATLMLRQVSNNRSGQSEMMQMMGFGESKQAADEVKVLTSRDLMGRVVDQLNLCTTYFTKAKRFWVAEFPESPIQVVLNEPCDKPVVVDVVVRKSDYKVKMKIGRFHRECYQVTALNQPIQTSIGELTISIVGSREEGKYRAIILPRMIAIDNMLKAITISRLSRESNIITFTQQTSCPKRAIATINTLLDMYNLESATDKNLLAIQTEQFLASRIEVVETELNNVEVELEAYKRSQHIADLNKTAENYQQLGDNYEQQVAELDAQKSVLDFIAEQVSMKENEYSMIPATVGSSNPTLTSLIQDYNNHVVHRNTLLQYASDENPVITRETELLEQKRQSIKVGINQAIQALTLQRQAVLDQQNEYNGRLAAIPETERRFLEMSREKQTKENQYLFLIEKREENAMLLASEAVPAKIIERAQQDPIRVSPKLTMLGCVSIMIGLMIPLFFYFIGVFRKEYL